jgi:hypothetical protein
VATGPTFAPELEQTIVSAVAELDRAILEARLNDDPLRLPLSALAAFLKAQQRLYVDGAQTLAAQFREGQKPLSDADLKEIKDSAARQFAVAANRQIVDLIRAQNWKSVLVGAGMLVLALGAGFGTGYWWHGSQQMVAGVSAGQQECQDVSGGTLCRIPVWTKLPPAR